MIPTNKDNDSGCSPISSNCVYKVYSLLDPNTEEVRYIGFTGRELSERLHEHLGIDCKHYKGNWINSLKMNGLLPVIELLEDNLTEKEVKSKEIGYIKLFKSFGARLTNLTNGGDGLLGYKHSIETKEKMRNDKIGSLNPFYGKSHSEELLKQQASKRMGVNNGFYGKSHSEEVKEQCRIAAKNQNHPKGFIHSDETKKKIGNKNRGRIKTNEEIEKISNSLKGRQSPTKGMKFSDEYKLKLSLLHKERWKQRKLNLENDTN